MIGKKSNLSFKMENIDLDLDLDIGIEDVIKEKQTELQSLNDTIKVLEEERNKLDTEISNKKEKLVKYKGGFKNYINTCLNTGYHAMILMFFMFFGYIISGIKFMGLKVWKAPTSIAFYIAFSAGYIILAVLEYLRTKKVDDENELRQD